MIWNGEVQILFLGRDYSKDKAVQGLLIHDSIKNGNWNQGLESTWNMKTVLGSPWNFD